MTRRVTKTVTVLSFLSLTTVPCNVRLGILVLSCRARLARRSLSLALGGSLRLALGGLGARCRLYLAARLLGQNRLDTGDVAAHHAHPRGVLELAAGAAEAQIELLLLQLGEIVL